MAGALRRAIGCGAGLTLLCAVTASSFQGERLTDNDRLVLFAVFEQSIRPWVALEREIAGIPGGPVRVDPRSLSACSDPIAPPECADVARLLEPDAHGLVTGAWDYREDTRRALADAFGTRNTTVATLPLADLGAVAPADPRDSVSPDFVIQVSLPGYISSGFALVYAQALRRGRARQGWAFVLSRFSGRWTVQHAYLLWMRQ